MNSGSSVSNLQDKVLSPANRINLNNRLESEKSFINNRKKRRLKIDLKKIDLVYILTVYQMSLEEYYSLLR